LIVTNVAESNFQGKREKGGRQAALPKENQINEKPTKLR
jgi:hypothetical protein